MRLEATSESEQEAASDAWATSTIQIDNWGWRLNVTMEAESEAGVYEWGLRL